jgi:hypothetical protein
MREAGVSKPCLAHRENREELESGRKGFYLGVNQAKILVQSGSIRFRGVREKLGYPNFAVNDRVF